MKIRNILLIMLFALCITGCKKESVNIVEFLSLTKEYIDEGETTVTIHAEYSYPSVMKEVMIHYSENINMSNEMICSAVIISGNSFHVCLTDLKKLTRYYYYYEYDNGLSTKKSEIKYFETKSFINGHEYVDLGLPSGLKWAICNVGANLPSEYGDYYAWGETTTKSDYSSSNCVTYGQEMGDISGNPQYDAARANWGGTWRMPTKAEFDELLNKCTWRWTTQGGNNGYKVTGPNGNSIFLPAAGYRLGTSLYYAGSFGYCWSSTPNESTTQGAYDLYFGSDYHDTNWHDRYYGRSVRPVSE